MEVQPSKNSTDQYSNKFDQLFVNQLDGVVITSEKNHITYISPSILKMTGLVKEQLLQKEIDTVIDVMEEDLPLLRTRALKNPGIPIPGPMFRLQHKNGSWVWFELIVSKLFQDSTINDILYTCRNVSEKIAALEELKVLSEREQIVARKAKIGIWSCDLTNNYLVWNDYMYELYGLSEMTFDHKIKSWIALIEPSDQKAMLNQFKQVKSGKGEFDIDIRISTSNGSLRYVKVKADLIKNETGKPLRLVGTNWDVTAQKLAENDLLRKNQLLNVAEKISMIGIWQWNLVTNVVKWSHNLYHIFGVKENSDIFFDTYFSFVHPDDKERVAAHIEKSLHDKFFVDLIHRIQLADGTIKTIQLFAEIITDKAGKAVDMIGSCQDVTEQRMAEQKFRGLLESAPDAMVIINEGYRIELVNSQTENIFGYSKLELVGQSVEKLIPKIIQKDGTLIDPTSSKPGNINDLTAIKKGGEKFPVEINLGTLHTAEGLLISVAIRDVSLRKKTEATLRKMAALKAKNEEMEQLTYITSHDLREPILTVKKYSEVLKEDYFSILDEEGKVLLNTIIRSVDRMDARINDLLDYAQLGQVKSLQSINCNEVVNVIIEDLNSLIESNNAKVTVSSLPDQLKAYPTEFSLIFQNLINNAIKFKKAGTAPVVTISSKKCMEGWEFEVSDNGIGIQEKNFEKIFSIFQRLHTTSEYEGTGIGLAQVKKLVELHNGKIHVQSKPGQGTTFFFSILTENL